MTPRNDRERRPLIVLLIANVVSITGNVFTTLAVPWFVLATTGSVTRVGIAAVASTLPIVISASTASALGSPWLPDLAGRGDVTIQRATAGFDLLLSMPPLLGRSWKQAKFLVAS